ncbi:MAG: acetolactate synthase [Bdellovibrionales bacterium RIFOXYD1_FULL_53_11]|nr:MAG: acetolactate synthase [Bdellovibrionales bacterium RIFOXYD1_FULL_53_11]
MNSRTRLSEYVLDYLADLGVTHIFVQTGAAISELIDAFTRNDKIKDIAVVHEQAGAFASEAYTKISGIPGVMMATSGPGGINLLNGVANSWFDSIPNIYITGQINSKFVKTSDVVRQVGFQENDIVAMAKPVTKYAVMVRDPGKIRYELEKAVHLATSGRPGPVLLDIPVDIQKQFVDHASMEGFDRSKAAQASDPELDSKISQFISDLEKSSRPVMLVGGGIRTAGAIDELRSLCGILKIPVITTWGGADAITSDDPAYRGMVGTYGGPGRNFAIQNADLLLSVGSRISGRITGGIPATFARKARKYLVDIDPAGIDPVLQQVKFDINIFNDVKEFIVRLLFQLKNTKIKEFKPWLGRTGEWLEKYDTVLPGYYQEKNRVNPYVFVRRLSELLAPDDVIVVDHGGSTVVSYQAFKTKKGQRLMASLGNAPMGYAMSGAIGAYYARRPGRVICLTGDGGFTMNSQELQTLKNYNIPVKSFILNNHVYGIIKQYQETNLGGRFEASGPDGYNPPDFLKVSEAYGIASARINSHVEMDAAIRRALDFDGPFVCDVNTHDYYRFEPRIFGWNTPIEDMYPYLPRDEFRNNMCIEPMPGWETPIVPDIPRRD